MAFEERKACLWHAFNALGEQGKGVGVKSQLKVLTQNIGTSLDLPNSEAGLDDYRSGNAITFRDYLYYLQVELFNRIQNSTVNRASLAKINFDRVDEICWMVCATRYAARKDKKLTDNDTYKLWRLFNFLAETDDSGELSYPVVIDREEAEFFAHKFLAIVSSSLDPVVLKCAIADARVLNFQEFLTLVESTVCRSLDKDSVALAMSELHEEFIVQVMKKGYLLKKGHVITNWKERWFVLTPRVLRYFTSRDEKDRKGEIFITQYCKAEALPEKVSSKPNRFSLVTEGKTYEICAPDLRTRTEWVSNLNSSAEHSSTSDTRQKRDCRRRSKLRCQQRALSKQEEEKRQKELDQMAKTRQELKSEKQARADAEARFQQEAALREAEQQRLREVEELRQQLQCLLEAERQAKKDEEIVRSLQSRILEEEFEKREKLEQLKTELEEMLEDEREKREGLEEERQHHESMLTEERHLREGLEEENKHQESMLTAEREKREDLEEMRRHHEVLLREEQQKLEQVEQERLNMDAKMEEALAKLHDAERVKEDLREKMLKKEQENMFNIKVSKLVHPEPLKFASHRGLGAFAHVELRHVAGSVSSDASPSGSIDGDGPAGDAAPEVTDVKTSINNNDKEDEQSNDKESPLVTSTLPADS